nr:hypothetical protein [Tanacetum cinerariifolium]
MIAKIDQDVDVVLEDDKEDDKKVANAVKDVHHVEESTQDQGRIAESQAEIYKIDLDHANKVLSMQEDETELAEVQEVVDVVTTAKLITKVVTATSETITAASINITATKAQVPAATLTAALARVTDAPKESKPLKKKQQIKQDEQYARELQAELNKNIDWDKVIDHVKIKAKKDPAMKKYQALKRKPQTEAQAKKNMMLYLKNVAGFKMDYFKGMSYDDIRPIFEAKFNSNVAFLLKTKLQIEEDENKALQRLNETPAERAAKRRKLDEEIEELKKHLHIMPNEDDDVYTEATPLARKKNQRSVHGLAKVKRWKLLESCGVQIITFTTTQLILLVERKYPLIRFTLDQMLNAVGMKCANLVRRSMMTQMVSCPFEVLGSFVMKSIVILSYFHIGISGCTNLDEMRHRKRQSHCFLLVMLRLELHIASALVVEKLSLGLRPTYTSCFSRRCPILDSFNLGGVNMKSLTIN